MWLLLDRKESELQLVGWLNVVVYDWKLKTHVMSVAQPGQATDTHYQEGTQGTLVAMAFPLNDAPKTKLPHGPRSADAVAASPQHSLHPPER
jgi:hypothetical protein